MKPVFAIRCQLSAPLGVIADGLDARGVPWRYVDVYRGEQLPDVTEASGLVVLGGEMNVDEVDAHPWLADVRTLTRRAVDAEVPFLGSCLGAQVLARAMGAPVSAGTVREVGFRKVEVLPAGADDPVLAPFAPSSLVFEFHQDECALPDDATLLATGDETVVQAFRVGEQAYGIQFHFEVTVQEITAWADKRPTERLRDEWGVTKQELLAQAAVHLEQQQRAGRALATAFARRLG